MTRSTLAIAALCAALAVPASAQSPIAGVPVALVAQAGGVPLRFANTDASDVLLGIARVFRANIVIPAEAHKRVSLNVVAHSLEEALTAVTGAAGLAWRQVGSIYVVASPADLKQALESRGERVRVPLTALAPSEAAAILEGALPYLTVRPAGSELLLVGAPADIEQARAILADQEHARAAESASTEVVTLAYATPAQVAAILKDAYPGIRANPVGATDKPGGMLSITGSTQAVAAARELVARVDVPGTPREPDRLYRVYHVKYSSAPYLLEFVQKAAPSVTTLMAPENYTVPAAGFRPLSAAISGAIGGGSTVGGGIIGGGATGQSGVGGTTGTDITGAGTTTGQAARRPGDRAKMLVMCGTAADLDAATRLLEQVDVLPKQVLVEVKVIDTSPERAEQLGISWSWSNFGFSEGPPGTAGTASATRPLGFGQFSRVPFSFTGVLNALTTRGEAKILASPRMQVIDNDEASIFIGDTLNVQLSQSAITGTTIQVAQFNVGIILAVRPRINADGNITMHIHPSVSTITAIGSGGLPQTSTRDAETAVIVKDGETIVIGGLIRDEVVRSVQEVPILAKLPLVGELFRNRTSSQRHTELLVIITPHIVS